MNNLNKEAGMANDTHGASGRAWIGVDLDGTLAEYHGWKGPEHIGPVVPRMAERVRGWVEAGKRVRIMTARVAPGKGDSALCRSAIERWLRENKIPVSEITHEKDHLMLELWDDRVVQVVPNTGIRADGKE